MASPINSNFENVNIRRDTNRTICPHCELIENFISMYKTYSRNVNSNIILKNIIWSFQNTIWKTFITSNFEHVKTRMDADWIVWTLSETPVLEITRAIKYRKISFGHFLKITIWNMTISSNLEHVQTSMDAYWIVWTLCEILENFIRIYQNMLSKFQDQQNIGKYHF